MSHSIVFLDRSTLDANVRAPNFPHSYKEYEVTAADQVVERLRDATIAIINKVPLREATLKQLPNLKLIAVAATGTDVIDKAYTKAHGIVVSNIRNYAFNTVPEHVFALAFALRRNIVAYVRRRAGRAVAGGRPVLLLRPPDSRHARLNARHRRLWRARQGGRQDRRSLWHESFAL